MKLAVYCLALVLVAAAVVSIVVMGAGLIDRHPSNIAGWHGQRREVFVDLDKLVELHPGWAAAQMMKSTGSDMATSQAELPLTERAPDVSALELPEVKTRPATPRWRLEDSAARRADEALVQLRSEQLAALDARLQATRKTMMDSAEGDLRLRAYDIEQEAAGKISAISQTHSYEQINLRVKAGAYKAMLGQPGVNESEVKRKLADVEDKLKAIEDDVKGQVAQVTADSRKTIAGLDGSADAKIASALSAYANKETRAIQDRIAGARNQMLGDICSLGEISGPDAKSVRSETARSSGMVLSGEAVVGPKPVYSGAAESREWNKRAALLEARVRRDVAEMVRKLADERHESVVFARKSPAIPDETSKFVDLVKGRGWRDAAPVLQGGRSI